MANSNGSGNSAGSGFETVIDGNAGAAQNSHGITTKAFLLNLATGLGLFGFQLTGFFLLKSSSIGRRLYQPKTYLVQERLRVEAIPVNPLKWIRQIFSIKGEELKLKCGLDGYFAIRFLRAQIVIFLPLMCILLTVLLPVNYNGGKENHVFQVGGQAKRYNIVGLDTLSWQNVAPTQTVRYWAHLVCALLAISWTLYRIYREKVHFITVRQNYLTSPEHRLKASARTILVTNIPSEYQSEHALKALFDVFVDNDDRSKLHVWVNRDYRSLRALVSQRKKLCHALEKAELKTLRSVNKQYRKDGEKRADQSLSPQASHQSAAPASGIDTENESALQLIADAFEADCRDEGQLWHKYLTDSTEAQVSLTKDDSGGWKPVSSLKFWQRGHRTASKIAWLRAEVSRLTLEIEGILPDLDKEARFPRQNSAFIQFDRQMIANMACALVTHHKPGCMEPRFLHVAPHEIVWPNMGLTSLARFIRTCIALILFVGMVFLWGIPASFLGILSQLESLRASVGYLKWLETWPSWVISLISGPGAAILLALLIQLVVPALCRKLAVLVGAPTRGRREVVTQGFYFTFLFIELVLVTSISSGLIATITVLIGNPTKIASTLATDLPKAANYFFNYLIIQALGFSGSLLFQYLRILFITTIWPWFTQTPREEAWLQTTIPHQMWANVFSIWTNFAAIGLIYSVIAPLMLFFISAVFMLFWFAYRHNYYYVQRNKVDTHGLLFENALSQMFAGVYVLEITLIGLFFLVRDTQNNVACTAQAIIMIVALGLTAAFHYTMESILSPLYELLPVTLEDKAVDAERERFHAPVDARSSKEQSEHHSDDVELSSLRTSDSRRPMNPTEKSDARFDEPTQKPAKGLATTAANARETMLRLNERIGTPIAGHHHQTPRSPGTSRRLEVADELGAAIARYPDELIDLSPAERDAELRAAYQDPVTREPAPIIWIPQDPAGVSADSIERARRYGRHLQYSNAGAYLTEKNKCEVTQPAPDVRSDWLLDWVL